MDILFLLLLLQIKHWYADFKIQTYMQTVKKGVWLDPIGISHTVDHIKASAVALAVFWCFFHISILAIIFVIACEGPYHYIVDYTKVKYGCKDNTNPLFWNQFGLDQMAHQLSYLAIAWYLLIK
jgi:Protein of unknown function (DUF3307)